MSRIVAPHVFRLPLLNMQRQPENMGRGQSKPHRGLNGRAKNSGCLKRDNTF
ncbi:hypothetical protein [Kingella oralis]|uniref:hypothetical protein n=1 Tax=Kingella oralis TaxID=505 RepID=UPI0034E3A180